MGPRAILKTTVVTGLALVVFTGCSTLGGGDTRNTVRATYQKVAKIEKNLDGPVAQLGTTAASLTARVEASEETLNRVNTKLEENQVKLADIEKKIDRISTILSRAYNLTGPAGAPVRPTDVTTDPSAVQITTPGQPPVTPGSVPPLSSPPVGADPNALSAPVPAAAPVTSPGVTPEATATPGAVAVEPESFKQGKAAFTNRDYAGAIRMFNDTLQKSASPDVSANAQFWKAKCYQKLEQYPDAIKEFEGVRTTYPRSARAVTAMHEQAVCLAKSNDKEAAKALFRKLITDYPMAPEATLAKSALQTLEGGAAAGATAPR